MCGIIGVVAQVGQPVAPIIYDGLTVLQHRGQDAAGIVTCNEEHLFQRKANGLVRDVFKQRHMSTLIGHMGVGHVRYPTAGTASCAEAQPFYTNSPHGISLAHNGNLTNADELREQLYREDLRHVNTSSDSEVLMNIFAHELFERGKMYIDEELRLNVEDVFYAVSRVHERCRGGYAIISMITGYGVLGFRDPWGIRPLILGRRDGPDKKGDEWILASESVALIALGCEVIRDVEPGEAVFITADGKLYERQCSDEVTYSPCIFEHVYFARPDSVIDGISVHRARLKMGRKLAARIPIEHPDAEIDVVIPVPDSGRIAAMELAEDLGVSFREGFVKNRYVGRTFLMPGQAMRKDSVRKKLNPIPYEFEGKNVLLVDDSIVRGNTSAKIVEMARMAGAKRVYFASAAPPVIHPNVYGIDMPAKGEYIAHGKTQEEVSQAIGADWLMYQKLEDLIDACQGGTCGVVNFDTSCFNGVYVTGDIDETYLEKLEEVRNDAAKAAQIKNDEIIEIHNEP